MKFTHLALAAFIGLSVSACAHTAVEPDGELKPGTAWVAHSPEWAAEAEAVYTEATAYIDSIEGDLPDGSWAVILDLDETVMNNVAYQISRDLSGESYTPESWHAWTQEEAATLVPGAAEFIRHVNAAGGHIAFVTNRADADQLATENNLLDLGLTRPDDFRVLLTRARPDGPSSKDGRYALVPVMLAAQGYPDVEVIAYVGDNKHDQPSEPGEWAFFCIDQGGMYGEFCATVPGPGR